MSDVDMLTEIKAVLDNTVLADHDADTTALARTIMVRAGLSTSLDQPRPVPGDPAESVHDNLIDWIDTSGLLNGQQAVTPMLRQVITERRDFGLRKYGTVLHAANKRNTLNDLLAELIDALAYIQVGVEQYTARGPRQWFEVRRLRMTMMACDTIAEIISADPS